MGSAKVIIKQQDRSTIVPSVPGIYGGIVIRSKKGPVNKPYLVTSENELIEVFGEPDTRYPEFYSAITYLQESNKLWVVRAAHDDVKYSAALVRSKVAKVPNDPLATFTDEMRIVQPLKDGLTQKDVDSFIFPTYIGNRQYVDTGIDISAYQGQTVKDIEVSSFGNLQEGDYVTSDEDGKLDTLNDETDYGESKQIAKVVDLEVRHTLLNKITLEDPVTVKAGTEILQDKDNDGNYTSYTKPVIVAVDAESSKEILVYNADYMESGDPVQIDGTNTTFKSKENYDYVQKFIHLDNELTIDASDTKLYKVEHFEYEERDSFLVYGKDPSVEFNKVSIGIAPSTNYEEAFKILVYYDGVLVETWEVTKTDFIDGFGNQLYLEDVINGKSKYINVLDNKNVKDKPLYTDHSYWQRLPEEIFRETGITLNENILKGHTQVYLSDVSSLSMGDRIKFKYDVNLDGSDVISKEYKVQSINSSENYIIIDRPLEEEEIDKTYTDLNGNVQNTEVLKFDETYNDLSKGIYKGKQYYPITELDKVFYNYPLNKIIYIGGLAGKLLDAGVNLLQGGSQGSAITTGDMINALYKLWNYSETPVTLLMTGGYYDTPYVQECVKLAQSTDLTHVYISSDPNAEDAADWKNALVNDVARLNLDTDRASYFAGWVKIFDRYNQKYVWVGPDAFAAASQSYTYRNYYMWYPAAGWLRGKIVVIDSKIKPNEGDRDFLCDNKINPLKYVKGSGFAIWGNRTLYSKPSPLNDRSVAMLLIVIKYGLKNMLEYKEFELNVERTWKEVENAITNFLEDIKTKNGLYDYQVAVSSVITDEDIDNNRMPVFVGIKPTRSIKEIPVTLAIFNSGAKIQVAL